MGNNPQQNDRDQSPQRQQDQGQQRPGTDAQQGGAGQNQANRQPGGKDSDRTHRKDESK